eukprot:CAMPEP_0116991550 /NCGR_PEP_ID=MMETSP0467-20121206/66204_1 /TAXON_ID=283647 /ORGANISM="Mesodinium pulex, Strain SPMC105" /LENGTH=269 /DNA_ID=CAMNT_0004688653 /DNA_START=46 /DNA_END=851 /DNA_ORIENTATION=+
MFDLIESLKSEHRMQQKHHIKLEARVDKLSAELASASQEIAALHRFKIMHEGLHTYTEVKLFVADLNNIRKSEVKFEYINHSNHKEYKLDFDTKPMVMCTARHKNAVNSVALSSDSRFVVSGSRDCSVKIYDTKKRQVAHTYTHADLQAKEIAVSCVQVSPDDLWLAAAVPGLQNQNAQSAVLRGRNDVDIAARTHLGRRCSQAVRPAIFALREVSDLRKLAQGRGARRPIQRKDNDNVNRIRKSIDAEVSGTEQRRDDDCMFVEFQRL